MIIFKCVSMLNPFYQPHRPPEAKPPRLSLGQKMRKWRERRREKKKLEESAFAAALDSVEAEEPVDQALGISVAEKQVDAAESAQATAPLAVLEADTEARLSTLRGDRAQTGICRFFRAGSGSSESSLFVTPTKKRGRPAFGSQTPDQVLAADKRLALREAERGVAEAKAQLAALKRAALAQEEKQVLPSPTPPKAKKGPGRPRKEASGETQLVFSAASSHGRQRGRHIKSATPVPKEKLAIQTAVDTAGSQLPPGQTILPSSFWEELSKQAGDVDAFLLRRYCSAQERTRVLTFLASATGQRSNRGVKRSGKSTAAKLAAGA